jgi:cell volume regulation protein A
VESAEQILRDFGLIIGAGLISQAIAVLLRLPEMVVLVAVGALIGPSVLGFVENPLEGVGAQLVFTIGVSLILFHGGTGISLRVLSRTAVGLGLLVLPGVFLTAFIVALVVAPVFGVPLLVALMIGAVLAATDPAILIPLFDEIRLKPKIAQTVIAESGFNDTVGTVLTLAVAGAVASGQVELSVPAFEFVRSLLLGTLIGVVAGVVLSYLISFRSWGTWTYYASASTTRTPSSSKAS